MVKTRYYRKINVKYTPKGDIVRDCLDEKYLSEIIYRYKEKYRLKSFKAASK